MISNRKYAVLGAVLGLSVLIFGCGKKEAAQRTDSESDAPPIVDIGSAPSADPAATVVEVNGKKLTEGECSSQIDRVMMSRGMHQLPSEQQSQARTALRQNVIDSFIAVTVLAREADARSIAATSADIDGALAKIKEQIPPGVDFGELLSRQGFSESDLRDQIAADLKINKLIDMQIAKIPAPTDEEIKSFYETEKGSFGAEETVHARHVLFATAPTDSEAAKAEKKVLAEKCRKELLEGASFAEMAKKHSDCPSKASGGDLGTFPRGAMVPQFETAAFSQAIDEIGPIVETRFGYHIVQVLSRNEPGVQPLDAVRGQIVEFLTNQKKQDAVDAYIDSLRDKAVISYSSET